MTVTGLVADLLQEGHYVRTQVGGASMAPAIQSGDTVTIAPLVSDQPRQQLLGQIVVCQDAFGKLRIHRLVGQCPVNPDRFITRGDNLPSCDQPREAGEVLGRVVVVERSWARRLLRLAQNLAGAYLIPSPVKL